VVVPEGHLIHRFARDQERTFAGRRLRVTSPQGRFVRGAAALDGRRLESVEAYGKHLFYWWEDGQVLHVHLGMRGKFIPVPPDAPPLPQSRVRVHAGDGGVDLVAPSECELIEPEGRNRVVGRLGPDPLRDGERFEPVASAVLRSTRPIGALLLDQAVVSGIGNVLRAEGLFAARIHPARPGDALTAVELRAVWSGLLLMMRRGVREGRIITVRPRGVPVEGIPEAEGRYVYKQERCRRCGSPVQTWELAGRIAYACPRDQPPTSGAVTGSG
jgi:endonuclease-8